MHTDHNAQWADLAAPSRLPSPDPHRIAPLAAAGPAHARIDRLPETATPADEAGGDQRNTKADSTDSAARIAVEQADKAFATLRATLALRGFELHIVGDGAGGTAYMVQRWNLHKLLIDQAAVLEFTERVGARA